MTAAIGYRRRRFTLARDTTKMESMTPQGIATPLGPGETAPAFVLPAGDLEGSISLDEYRGRTVLLSLMRGLQCPFCRRNIALIGRLAPRLREAGVEPLVIVGTTADRARFYLSHRPAAVRVAADAELETHRRYGIPCYPMSPHLLDQYRTTRVDPFSELPAPLPLLAADGTEVHDVFDRLDGFVPTDVDQRDRTRQFREAMQVCGQYMIDGTGVVRWARVEGDEGGLSKAGVLASEAELLRAARSL
jgi:peroxiredoxin